MDSYKLLINPRKCTLCGLCSKLCSEHHLGTINPGIWTIYVQETTRGRKLPKVCIDCGQCITACPTGAIKFQPVQNMMMISVDKQLCNLCAGKTPKCVQICPSEVIKVHASRLTPIICDFCGGHPVCAENCPGSAILMRAMDEPTQNYLAKISKK